MSAPDPEGISLIGKVAGTLVGLGTVMVSPVLYVHKRLDRKADKSAVAAQFEAVQVELENQRHDVAKIFDQMRENEQRAQDRHEKVMEAVYSRK